jgi:nucleotide-binding universal stress UspA family protein
MCSNSNQPLLLALFDTGLPMPSLERALSLAAALKTRLHVLRVVLGRSSFNAVSPQVDLLSSIRPAQYALESDRRLHEWLAQLSVDCLPDEICTRSGDFVTQVAARALQLDACLVVMPPAEGRLGELASKLALAAQLPVLVIRAGALQGRIMAAADLRDPTYPVLRTATSLAESLDASVIALHNVSPLTVLTSGDFSCAAPADTRRSLVPARREQLEHALRVVGSPSTAVVADEVDPVDAILAEAQARDVDLVIVGTRRHSWWERLVGSGVAARVVNGTDRSVLVVPIAAGVRLLDTPPSQA